MKFKLLLLVPLCLALLSAAHEYHVSITQIDYNTESSTLQVAMKLHNEDVEVVLKKNFEGITNLEKELEKKEVNDFLKDYLTTSFSLMHQDSIVDLKFIGEEFEDDDIWIYLESPEFESMPDLNVKNTLFLAIFHNQNNMVHYSKDDQVVQSTVLNKKKQTHTFTIE